MFVVLTVTVLTSLFLAPTAIGSPVVVRDSLIHLPIAKRINATNIKTLLRHDQERAVALRTRPRASESLAAGMSPDQIPVTNAAVSYTAEVRVGDDSSSFNLIVDTGSSNTWVGAAKALNSRTARATGEEVFIEYGSGLFAGEEVTDTFSLGPGMDITHQSLGSKIFAGGFSGVDGILGIGPVDLTVDTLFPNITAQVPTVTDNLFSQGAIPANEVAVSFEPVTSDDVTNGELTFGGTDSTKFTGSITYTPITPTKPASMYWGINQTIVYGSTNSPILENTAGIVDTGTTLILIASDAFSRYQSTTGATPDSNTGLLVINQTQYNSLQSLYFVVQETAFELTPNAQIWPRSLNAAIGGDSDSIYLVIGDIGTSSGQGLDFINGLSFLERFYSVFDTAGKRVGLANTPFTTATTN